MVADQIGSPTYTKDLAVLLCDMVNTDKYGIYHATNEGYCSWAEFAEEIFKTAGMDVNVNHITSAEYPTKAKRPKNSRLIKSKLSRENFAPLAKYRDGVHNFINNFNK